MDQAFVSGANFFLGLLLARILGFDEYGKYVLIWSVILLLNSAQTSLFIAPFQTAYSKLQKEEVLNAVKAVSGLLGPILLVTAIIALLLVAGLTFLGKQNHPIQTLLMALGGLSFLGNDFFRRICLCRGLVIEAFASDAISLLTLLAILLCAPIEFVNIGSFGIAACISFFAGPLLVNWKTNQLVNFKYGIQSRSLIQSFDIRNAWLFFATIPQWIASNGPIFAFSATFGNGFVGALRSAQNLIGITHIAFQALENIAPPIAAKLKESHSRKHDWRRFLFLMLIALVALTSITGLVIYYFFDVIFITAYGKTSFVAKQAFPYLVITYILIAVSLPTRISLRVQNGSSHILHGYTISTLFAGMLSLLVLVTEDPIMAYTTLVITQAGACIYWLHINRTLIRKHDQTS